MMINDLTASQIEVIHTTFSFTNADFHISLVCCRLALRRGNPPQPLTGMNHLGLAELGLAAFTGHQAASPTENGFLPSTSPPQAASPVAASPPDPWGEFGRSPTEAWEMFSRSPNTAFLHSCQSPPSSTMFPGTLQSPPHPVQSPSHQVQSLSPPVQPLPIPVQSPPPVQSPHPVQSPPQLVQSALQPTQSPPQSAQSPSDTNPFPFTTQVCPSDPFFSKDAQDMCHSDRQQPAAPRSPASPAGRENPFLSTTNPFIQTFVPVREVASGPPQPPVECPRVVVASGGSGCSPGRPVWTADLFSGSKNKNVICS